MGTFIHAFIQNNPELKVIKFLLELLHQVVNEDEMTVFKADCQLTNST